MALNDYTPREQEFLKRFTAAVVERRLTVPTVFFLESMTPLNFVASQLTAFLTPIVHIFMRAGDLDVLQQLLEKRSFIPDAIALLEEADAARKTGGEVDHAD
jgi:hypothetical protein